MNVEKLIKVLKGLPSDSMVVCVDQSSVIKGRIKVYRDIKCGRMDSNDGETRCAIVFDTHETLNKSGIRQDKYN